MGYDTWKTTDRLGDELDGESRAVQYAHDQARDLRFQTAADAIRTGRTETLLWHVHRLMNGDRDPFHYSAAREPLLALADSDGWSAVIGMIAQVQKEKEAEAA
jgi:hypothetical protein